MYVLAAAVIVSTGIILSNSMLHGMLHGAWCMVHGAWCMVHVVWCMLHGAWCRDAPLSTMGGNATDMGPMVTCNVAYAMACGTLHGMWYVTSIKLMVHM